jgi:hypothetical protein
MTCPGEDVGNQQPLVADLVTGQLAPVDPVGRRIAEREGGAAGQMSSTYTDVGRHWLRVTSTYYHDARWDDMYRRTDGFDFSVDDVSARRNPDPDERSGSIALCRPLHRRIGPQGFDRWPTYARYQYERPYGLTSDGRGLVLERCGSRARRLSRETWDASEQLGGRYVTWSERPDEVHLYDIRRRRERVWHFKGASPGYLAVVHTRTHIAVMDTALYPPNRRVYLARIR